jgi:hypothetical protein
MAGEGDGGVQALKLARNQALWREINERVKAIAETSGAVEFLCECADLECTKSLKMSLAEYEHIRSYSVRFPVAHGHVFPEVEDVVEEHGDYDVVEKRDKAAEIVAKLDPRSRA